jgi:hypothetical protein
MDIGFILILFFFLLLVILFHLSFQQSLDSLGKRSDVTVDEGRAEFFDEIVNALHCSSSDLIIVIFGHDGEKTRHDNCAEMLLKGLWVPGCTWKTLLDWWNHTVIPGFDESEGKIGVAMADLDTNILIEVLVVFLEQPVGLFKIGSELQGTSLSELAKSMDSCCFLVLLSDFLGGDINLFLIFGVRIKTEVFLLGSGVLLGLAGSNHNGNEVIEDNFEPSADGISNKVKEGESSLANFRVLLDSQQLIYSLHSPHNVCFVEGLTIGILRFAEDIGQLSQNI